MTSTTTDVKVSRREDGRDHSGGSILRSIQHYLNTMVSLSGMKALILDKETVRAHATRT